HAHGQSASPARPARPPAAGHPFAGLNAAPAPRNLNRGPEGIARAIPRLGYEGPTTTTARGWGQRSNRVRRTRGRGRGRGRSGLGRRPGAAGRSGPRAPPGRWLRGLGLPADGFRPRARPRRWLRGRVAGWGADDAVLRYAVDVVAEEDLGAAAARD